MTDEEPQATTTFGLAIAVLMSLCLIPLVVLAVIGANWLVGR